jgi:hypothetical protein
LAKNKFKIKQKAGRMADPNNPGYLNPYNKTKILYVDTPLPRNDKGDLYPSDVQYIKDLLEKKIYFANSLEELEKLLK